MSDGQCVQFICVRDSMIQVCTNTSELKHIPVLCKTFKE